jgi:hypothetical protein
MRVTGLLTKETVRVLSDIRIKIHISAISRRARLMGEESINGATGRFTMESGLSEGKKAMVCGQVLMVWTRILENGKILKLRAMACIDGKMVIDMKGNGRSV